MGVQLRSEEEWRIQHPIEHLRWSVNFFRKNLYLRCLIGFWVQLCRKSCKSKHISPLSIFSLRMRVPLGVSASSDEQDLWNTSQQCSEKLVPRRIQEPVKHLHRTFFAKMLHNGCLTGSLILSVNPKKWSNTQTADDKLFECVWPFVGLALKDFTRFSQMLHIKWLVSIWNATLGWNGWTSFHSYQKPALQG